MEAYGQIPMARGPPSARLRSHFTDEDARSEITVYSQVITSATDDGSDSTTKAAETVPAPFALLFEEKLLYSTDGTNVVVRDAEGREYVTPMASGPGPFGTTLDDRRSTWWPPLDLDVQVD